MRGHTQVVFSPIDQDQIGGQEGPVLATTHKQKYVNNLGSSSGRWEQGDYIYNSITEERHNFACNVYCSEIKYPFLGLKASIIGCVRVLVWSISHCLSFYT